MLIETNFPYLVKESVPVEAVEEWLNEHPEKRAEALTGKVQNVDGPFGRTREGMEKDRREAVKAIAAKKKSEKARTWSAARREAQQKKPPTAYQLLKDDIRAKLKKGDVVTYKDFPGWVRRHYRNLIVRELREGEGMAILALYEGQKAVGWICQDTNRILKKVDL